VKELSLWIPEKAFKQMCKSPEAGFRSNSEKACVENAHQSSGEDGMGVGSAYSVKS